MNFGRALTLGVEEELQLVDPETLALAPGSRAARARGLKTELFSLPDRDEHAGLRVGRRRHATSSSGLRRAGARGRRTRGSRGRRVGAHPFSRAEEQQIVAEPRYVKMLEELGPELEAPARVRPARSRRHGELRGVPADARGDRARGCRTCSPSRSTRRTSQGEETGALSARRPGCASCRGAPSRRRSRRREDWEDLHRRDRRGLHAQLVGCAAAPAARHDRGAHPRPADGGRSLGGARRAVQALCVAAPAPAEGHGTDLSRRAAAAQRGEARTARAPRAGRAGSAGARHLGSRRGACASRRRRFGSSRPGAAKGSRPSWPSSWSGPRHDPAPLGALPAAARSGAARAAGTGRSSSSSWASLPAPPSSSAAAPARSSRRIAPSRRLSSGSRTARGSVRAVWFGVPGQSDEPQPVLDRRARAALGHAVAADARALVLFRESTIGGTFAGLGGVEGLGTQVILRSGRLPAECTAGALRGPPPARCRRAAARAREG